MNVSSIIDYLIEKGEFIDETLEHKISLLFSDKYYSYEDKREKLTALFEKEFDNFDKIEFINIFFPIIEDDAKIIIRKSYEKTPKKRSFQDFVRYFNARFKSLEKILKNRSELSGLTSISRIRGKTENQKVSLIAMILEINETKNGHYILEVEDLSGIIKVLIHKDNKELIDMAKDLVLDEVIGIVGQPGGEIIFSNGIIRPDVPLSKELKKSPQDHYAVFSGDQQFGSKMFMKQEFMRFLLWINGKLGTLEQRQMAKKVKYFFLVGDVIEGAGIFPGQEHELEVEPVREQYELAAKYLSKIPSHIKIIICPGNHDVGRIAEPQLPIDTEYAKPLWDLPNVIMVSNPALISIDVTENFSGLDVLMYHGGSLPYYADAISTIRSAGGLKASDDIMVHLLKMRHLAPTHGSTLYVPDEDEDALTIDTVPDIFVTGHIHRAQTKSYRNVTCINSSSWVEITEYQEKRGIEPQPGRAFIVSLKTRDVKVMNFSSQADSSTVSEFNKAKATKEASKEKKREDAKVV